MAEKEIDAIINKTNLKKCCVNVVFTCTCTNIHACTLNSSHTLAYKPNARRAYEKSQHAEDFGHITLNSFL